MSTDDTPTLIVGRGDRREQIAEGVYFTDGQLAHPIYRTETGGLVLVDEWHYQLLSSAGTVMGHGDGYLDEEHVRAALASVLDDYNVPYAEGEQRDVDERDAAVGKRSATDSPREAVSA